MENTKPNPTPRDSRRENKPERNLSSSFAEQDRREQRNMDDQPQKRHPEPEDPKGTASQPQGTTADQVANMENEGQAQEPVDPEDKNRPATTPRKA